MSLTETTLESMHACDHSVRFYESDDYLCESVGDFVAEGLRIGQPVLIIATPDHAAEVIARLDSIGFDVPDARAGGSLTMIDAEATLSTFMRDSVPDPVLFHRNVGGVLDRIVESTGCSTVRAYGEMVDVLWRQDNAPAAVQLEQLWNDLAHTHQFVLLCGYAISNFYKESHVHHFDEICRLHTHVVPTESYTALTEDAARLREVTHLQQRSRLLESELARRELIEEELRQAKEEAERANSVKSDFLAVMSHELRTPLNAIIGYGDLLAHEVAGPLSPVQLAYLARIKSGANQLLDLINQILSLSRIEAGMEAAEWHVVDVAELATETAQILEPAIVKNGLSLAVSIERPALLCETDPVKLRQILLNLLSNAVKFTSKGYVELIVRTKDGCVLFEVRDTGVGIHPQQLARVFEPFVQVDGSKKRSHGGSGLGLTVSRDLARLLGGDLTVISATGLGSTFTLSLPLDRGINAG